MFVMKCFGKLKENVVEITADNLLTNHLLSSRMFCELAVSSSHRYNPALKEYIKIYCVFKKTIRQILVMFSYRVRRAKLQIFQNYGRYGGMKRHDLLFMRRCKDTLK